MSEIFNFQNYWNFKHRRSSFGNSTACEHASQILLMVYVLMCEKMIWKKVCCKTDQALDDNVVQKERKQGKM